MKLYKLVGANHEPLHGGSGAWVPGEWRTVTPPLVPCENGLHVCRVADLPRWVRTDAVVWCVETRGERLDASDKVVVSEARLVELIGVLTREILVAWAADCAERVLPLFEARCPGDDRPKKAIEAARSGAAARADAAACAADAAACAADAAADAADAAACAADAAACAAAADAADAAACAADAAARADAAACAAAAARAAARAAAAERQWQGERLLQLITKEIA